MGTDGTGRGGSLDREGLAAGVTEHLDGLYRYARLLTGDAVLAEDVVQDTVLRALERADQFRGDASLRTWLHRIAHNIVVDRARHRAREVVVEDVEERWMDDDYTVEVAEVIERAAMKDELEDALVRLPDIYRTAVVLHDVEGWTNAEIAETVGIGLPAAKQRLRRGRMALVTALAAGAERRDALEGTPMRCWDARRLVSDYLDRELDGARARAVEAHLRRCPTCPPLYAALVGVRAEVGRLRDSDRVIPAPLLERLARTLAPGTGEGPQRGHGPAAP
jgi:RNA polymerase sigma-70 factor, ECF subfamily